MQPIFDSHCHIDMVLQKEKTIEEITESLKENAVEGFIQIAADPEAIDFAQKFVSQNHDFEVHYTIGMHPGEAHEIDPMVGVTRAREASKDPRFVAIGEIGLDYFYGKETKQVQNEVFEQYIDLALELNKPICIHTRDAHEDTMMLLKKASDKVDILIHCFTGNKEQVKDYLNVGCFISFSGIVTFKNARELQEAALICDRERMLVETDAPFLTPVPYRGRANHPAMVRHTLNFLAELRDENADSLADVTMQNTRKFYGI